MELTLPKPIAIGRWWFQNRSLSPLPLLVLLFFVNPDFEMNFELFLLGAIGVVAAEALRLWAVSYAGSGTRTRGDKVYQLAVGGPYQWTRNPLYIANVVLYTSFAFLFGHIILSVFAVLYFVLQYSYIVIFEESLLAESFGRGYKDYCASVPRWFLGQRLPVVAPSGTSDLRAAFRSEKSTLISIGVMWLLWVTRFIWR